MFKTADSIVSYLDHFQDRGWPLVIGEFGWQFQDGEVDDQTIAAEAQRRGLGYWRGPGPGTTTPILDWY